MDKTYLTRESMASFALWQKRRQHQALSSFTLELTARCNASCRHCYINLAADDSAAPKKELSLAEICHLADQAVAAGALWCLITGGEPLLREDFPAIYSYLKRQGLLISVFTNATCITEEHISLFTKLPPYALEVTVYGLTEKTYAAVTRRADLFKSFLRGLALLKEASIPVSLKTVAIRSTLHEFEEIAAFCRQGSATPFRFDPFIQLRLDRNEQKNSTIRKERLTAQEIAELEKSEIQRLSQLQKHCEELVPTGSREGNQQLFTCGSGLNSLVIGHDGFSRPCLSLCHPDFTFDLRTHSLLEARQRTLERLHCRQAKAEDFSEKCGTCGLINLCMWCPALAYLESGQLDTCCTAFCDIAQARWKNLAAQS